MAYSFHGRLPRQDRFFVPYLVAGHPSVEATIDFALAMQENGATTLELGIPYSDPLADGPMIQKAAQHALNGGMTLKKALQLVPIMREKGLKIPVIVFTYFNPVLQLGEENFLQLVRENQLDGVLIPDLPYEESEYLRSLCKKLELVYISLVAPTSQTRLQKITNDASGFLYCVSSLGVTGERKEFSSDILKFVENVRDQSNIPVVVGFGIGSQEHVELWNSHSNGVVVGTAVVRKMDELYNIYKEDRNKAINDFSDFIKNLTKPLIYLEEVRQE